MQEKMEKEENKKEYSKRTSVEGPFGTLKQEYLIEKHQVIGIKETEELITLDAIAYNIKRLYNIKQQIKNNKGDIINFCESTSAKNNLELQITIF